MRRVIAGFFKILMGICGLGAHIWLIYAFWSPKVNPWLIWPGYLGILIVGVLMGAVAAVIHDDRKRR